MSVTRSSMPWVVTRVRARSVRTGPRRRGRAEPGGSGGSGLVGGLVALGGSGLAGGGGLAGLLVGLLALDAGLGLGLGQLGLEGLLGDLRGDVDDERLGVGDERGALGQLDLAGEDLGAGREALDRDGDALGDVGRQDLELQARVVGGDDGLGAGLALEVDVDVDDDLLALACTMTRSTCSMTGLIGSRWTSLARASCSSPSMTMVSRALLCFRASIDWWPGRVMCTGSLPWPYITAGILLSRRILRAAPLPNWVRASATSLLSDTCAPGEWKSDRAVGPRRGTWHRTTGARTARGSTGSAFRQRRSRMRRPHHAV